MKKVFIFLLILFLCGSVYSKGPYRVGTTSANYLGIGLGSAGSAMGGAYVSVVDDISSIYWNPSGLGYLESKEIGVIFHPWIARSNIYFVGAAIPIAPYGTFGLSIGGINYEEIEVTTMTMQDGTGETFRPSEYNVNLSYGKKIANWLSFGTNLKYITSNIWHMSASAVAVDMGLLVQTHFFDFGKGRENGMNIGMSISNYGTQMKYGGMDLLHPIDIAEDEAGNYEYAEGKLETQSWELPLIFRVGASINPINTDNQKLTLSADALHPNNNSESVNVGAQYELTVVGQAKFLLRTGYHGIALEDSQFGPTFGAGFILYGINNYTIKINYSYKHLDLLGSNNMYSIGLKF